MSQELIARSYIQKIHESNIPLSPSELGADAIDLVNPDSKQRLQCLSLDQAGNIVMDGYASRIALDCPTCILRNSCPVYNNPDLNRFPAYTTQNIYFGQLDLARARVEEKQKNDNLDYLSDEEAIQLSQLIYKFSQQWVLERHYVDGLYITGSFASQLLDQTFSHIHTSSDIDLLAVHESYMFDAGNTEEIIADIFRTEFDRDVTVVTLNGCRYADNITRGLYEAFKNPQQTISNVNVVPIFKPDYLARLKDRT